MRPPIVFPIRWNDMAGKWQVFDGDRIIGESSSLLLAEQFAIAESERHDP